MLSSLAARDFRALWLGSMASSFAMNMQIVARGWLVYDLTESTLALAWVTLSFMLPQVFFAMWGGVLADRLPKRRIIAIGQGLNFVATAVMAYIVLAGAVTFWDFIWMGLFNGTVLALSMPARQAFVPELVGDELVFNAMALNSASWNLSRILGPTLAGGIIAVIAAGDTTSAFGVGVVYCIIATLYLIASLTTAGVRQPGKKHVATAGQSPLGDIIEGMRYVWHTPRVRGLILLSLAPFLFGMPINTLLPAFSHDVLRGGPDDLGLLLGAMGIGAITGALMLARLGNVSRKGVWLVGTCIAWGVLMGLFATTRSLLWSCAVIALVGWVSAWNVALNRGLLQTIASPQMRGRIMSIDLMSQGLMPLGIVPIGYLAQTASIPIALGVAGSTLVIAALWLSRLAAVRSIDATERALTHAAAQSDRVPGG
jgi:predicted MFS family arabinose efflux permease